MGILREKYEKSVGGGLMIFYTVYTKKFNISLRIISLPDLLLQGYRCYSTTY